MINRIHRLIEEDEETTMRLEFAFLCDYVDFTGHGLFNAYGAGVHELRCGRLPDGRCFVLMMNVEYDPREDSGAHTIEIRIIDPDGKNCIKPIAVKADFLSSRRFYDLDIKLCPSFDRYGQHSVEVRIDGDNILSYPLDITKGI